MIEILAHPTPFTSLKVNSRIAGIAVRSSSRLPSSPPLSGACDELRVWLAARRSIVERSAGGDAEL